MPQSSMLGPVMGLAAYFSFSCMDLMSKLLAGSYPTHILIAANGFMALVAFMVWSRMTMGQLLPRPDHMKQVVAYGALSAIGMLLAFYGYRVMPTIADTYAIGFSGPLFTVVMAYFFLREHISAQRWLAVAIGFAGVMVVLQPDVMALNPAAIAPLSSAFCFASASVVIRSIKQDSAPQAVLVFVHVTLLAIMVPYSIIMTLSGATDTTPLAWPSGQDTMLLVVSMVAYTMGQFFIIGALARADASLVIPMSFTQMFWGVTFGWLIWGTLPRSSTIIGVSIVIIATIYILRDARRMGMAAAASPGPASVDQLATPEAIKAAHDQAVAEHHLPPDEPEVDSPAADDQTSGERGSATPGSTKPATDSAPS
ncbi:MAG: DMT family transporter [Pseudomonadota bacterium]